jgi:peroxiredoxin Q/BCP
MSIPNVGTLASDFTLADQAGVSHTLSKELGKWVLIYFYPKDDTPGCTKQACAIRDSYPTFKKLGITVFGISTDSEESHQKFAEKYDLPFTLLADPDKKVVEQYGVFGDKKFMGREYKGVMRTSFLISPDGKIAKVYENVKPEVHAEEVLTDLKTLQK